MAGSRVRQDFLLKSCKIRSFGRTSQRLKSDVSNNIGLDTSGVAGKSRLAVMRSGVFNVPCRPRGRIPSEACCKLAAPWPNFS